MSNSPAETRVTTALAARRQRGRRVRGALVFVSCVLLANALVGDDGLAGTIKAREDYRRMAEGLAQLEAENAGLREQARRLESDPATISYIAREELGLIRPGEILFVLQDMTRKQNFKSAPPAK